MQRARAAPAVRIGVLIWRSQMPAPFPLEPSDDEIVGLARRDETPFDLGPLRAGERAVGSHGTDERETVFHTRLIVVRAERRRHVDEARAVLRGDERAGHDHARRLIVGERNHLERAPIPQSQQLAPRKRAQRTQLGEGGRTLTRPAGQTGACRGQDQTAIANLILAVLHLGMHRHRDVGKERPRRRRPDQELTRGIRLRAGR